MFGIEEELKELEISVKNRETKLKELRIAKAKELNIDKMFLFIFNNRGLIKSHCKIKRDMVSVKKSRLDNFKEKIHYNHVQANFHLTFFKFTTNSTLEISYVKDHNEFKILEFGTDSTMIFNANFSKFEEWGNILLKLYYIIENTLGEVVQKERVRIEQLTFENNLDNLEI